MGYEARAALEVRVDGYVVGYADLTPRAGDMLGASLTFDSYANSGYADNASLLPFPASWPGSLPPQPLGISAHAAITTLPVDQARRRPMDGPVVYQEPGQIFAWEYQHGRCY